MIGLGEKSSGKLKHKVGKLGYEKALWQLEFETELL